MITRRNALLGLVALFPLGADAKKKKKKKKGTLEIVDHTAEWGAAIQEAINIVNPLLPKWYPPLKYVRGNIAPLTWKGKVGQVNIYTGTLHSSDAAGEANYGDIKTPGHAGVIGIKTGYPANSKLVIHELMHVLAHHSPHDEWSTMNPPFDASLIKKKRNHE
jgi:hypothetical protein